LCAWACRQAGERVHCGPADFADVGKSGGLLRWFGS